VSGKVLVMCPNHCHCYW